MKDRHSFGQSDMTRDGWRDYNRALLEIASQRDDKTSRYRGVSRVHCTNGYVDVRGHYGAVVNGSSSQMNVDEYRVYANKQWNVYDYNYR